MDIRIATRKSALALWQAEHVAALLEALPEVNSVGLVPLSTRGDEILDKSLQKIGGKGLFIKELEIAMQRGEADIAVVDDPRSRIKQIDSLDLRVQNRPNTARRERRAVITSLVGSRSDRIRNGDARVRDLHRPVHHGLRFFHPLPDGDFCVGRWATRASLVRSSDRILGIHVPATGISQR